jgi:hypothetical protein
MEKTNDIRYNTVRTKGNLNYEINIRLNDECHNGIEDFAITGSIWPKGKPKADRNILHCGAIGDELAKVFPDLSLFNSLHLAKWDGVPDFGIGNMMYFLENEKMTRDKWCTYYRIENKFYKELYDARFSDAHFRHLLYNLGIIDTWKKQADEAIAILEEWTGKTFVSKATKKSLHECTPEEETEYQTKLASGYYSVSAIMGRETKKINALWEKRKTDIIERANTQTATATEEKNIDLAVLEIIKDAGLPPDFDNYIFYNHTKKLCFLWRNYPECNKSTLGKVQGAIKLWNSLDNGIIAVLDKNK